MSRKNMSLYVWICPCVYVLGQKYFFVSLSSKGFIEETCFKGWLSRSPHGVGG